MGSIEFSKLLGESNLQWTYFSSENTVPDEFIYKQEPEFIIRAVQMKLDAPVSSEEVKKHLLQLLISKENKEIFDWIDANFCATAEPSFIRALVTAVHENAIKNSGFGYELDVSKLKERTDILTRYIDHNGNSELQALYAILSLLNQLHQPKGILRQIFDILYDDDVITEKSFINWELSGDAEGKAEALLSVKSFLTYLKETD